MTTKKAVAPVAATSYKSELEALMPAATLVHALVVFLGAAIATAQSQGWISTTVAASLAGVLAVLSGSDAYTRGKRAQNIEAISATAAVIAEKKAAA
jgi:hypothetical protein